MKTICHINIIKRKDEYPDADINYYMDIVSWNSFISNDDGEGYFGFTNRKFLCDRSLNKILYKNLDKFHTLITHQRFATSGFNLSNVHPHESKNFILQHNGVFTGLGDKEKSDTKVYLEKLEEYYGKNGHNLVDAIKHVSNDVRGSFSIVLLSKKSNRIYYYKNRSTNMFIIDDKNYLVMSTNNNNLKVARIMFGIKSQIREVKHDILYEITTAGLKYIARLQPKEIVIHNKDVEKTLRDFRSEKSRDDFEAYFDDKLRGFGNVKNDMREEMDADDLFDNSFYYIDEKGVRRGLK